MEGSPNICLPVLSVLLGPWGKFRWPRKRSSGFCGRFPSFSLHLSRSLLFENGYVEGSPNVSVHLSPSLLFEKGYVEGSPNVSVHLSPSLLFEKGYLEGSPNFCLHLSPSLLWSSGTAPCGRSHICFDFSPTALALGSSAIVTVLGQNDTFVFLGSLQQMAFASQKVLWSVPQTVLYICLTVCCGFLGKWLLLQKGSVEGSANCTLHLSPSVLLGPKLRTYTNPVCRKRPIMSVLLGYSLGLFFFFLIF